MENGISIIICCYNSERTIKRTIEHIIAQSNVEDINKELFVVDNNCTDSTISIIRSFDSLTIPIYVVKEITPGLMAARKSGISHARYSLIQFCDDDNFLCKNYLATIWKLMKDTKIGACGGQGIAIVDNGILPEWFEKIQGGYACGNQLAESGKCNFLYGAGLCIRKSILDFISAQGINYLLSGRKGNTLLSGDDTELCCFIRQMGLTLWYEDSISFQHCLPLSRLTQEYAIKMFYGFGIAVPVIDVYNCALRNYKVTYWHLCKQLVKSIWDYILMKTKRDNRKNLYSKLDMSVAKGRMNGYITFKFKKLLQQYYIFKEIPKYA